MYSFLLLISILTLSHAGIIVNYGYRSLTASQYTTEGITILEDTNGKRSIPSQIAYRCKDKKFAFGSDVSKMQENVLVNLMSPLYNSKQNITDCIPEDEDLSILGYQFVGLNFNSKISNETNNLKHLCEEDEKLAPYFIVSSSLTPNDLEKIKHVVQKAQFIPRFKLHAGLVMNGVKQKVIDEKEEYLIIDCSSDETSISKISYKKESNEFTIEKTIQIPITVDEINDKLMEIIGRPKGVFETQSILLQANEMRKKLSSNKEISMMIDEYDETITVTRDQFNDAIKDIIAPLEEQLKEFKAELKENSMVFLIGGLSYTPKIKEMVKETFGEYSIRITGDEFMMESARLLIMNEANHDKQMKLNNILPYPVDLVIDGKKEDFLKQNMIMNFELSVEIPLAKEIQMTTTNKFSGKTKIVRTFNIEKPDEKKTVVRFTVVPLEKGIINELLIEDKKIGYTLPFNKTVINQQLNQHITKKIEDEQEQQQMFAMAREYMQMMKDVEEILKNEPEKFNDTELLPDIQKRMMWLEEEDEMTITKLEINKKEFDTKFEKVIKHLEEIKAFMVEVNGLSNKTVEMVDKLRELGYREGDTFGTMLYQVIQRGIKTEKDRKDLRATIDYILENGPKVLEREKKNKINDFLFILLFIVVVVACGYCAWWYTRTPKKVKKTKVPPKNLKIKKE